MTVAELIEELKKYPLDAKVMREGGDHLHDYRHIVDVEYNKGASLAVPGDTVILS